MLEKKLEVVHSKILKEKKTNPNLADPKIIAISKKQSAEKINRLYDLGVRDFGENYLQEALEKMEMLQKLNINWHFIGSLQTKKLKEIVGRFSYIHSVSRIKECEKISALAFEKGIVQRIFVQVNIGEEDSKGGVAPGDALKFCLEVEKFRSLETVGIMTFPPIGQSEDEDSHWFKKSRQVFLEIQTKMNSKFNRLSMGTSQNYEVAFRQGATDLRIGESLFGRRKV